MPKHSSYFSLLLFLCVVAGVAFSGAHFQPGDWYAHLAKPDWTPPNWFFPFIWTILYIMIAVAGWLIFSVPNLALKSLWVVQLALNGLWSWIFFGMHSTGLGLVDILAMFVCIALLLYMSFKVAPRIVAWLLAPYLVWVGCASALNAFIYIHNPA